MLRSVTLLSLLTACGGEPAVTTSGFATGGGPDGPDATTATTAISGSSGTDTGSTSAADGSSSTSSSSDASTAAMTTDPGSTTTAPFPDVGSGLPAGCEGKIDFLFVLSNSYSMDAVEQAKYLEALPIFITTIGEQFGNFDSHVMVVDTSIANACWDCCKCEGVPESFYDIPSEECDYDVGSGVTLTLGEGAANKRCSFAGGHRYITSDEPDPTAAFLCAAQGGFSGSAPRQANAMVAAVEYYNNLNGCNAGFLRKDALLVVTVVSDIEDYKSYDTPKDWRAALVKAKFGDPEALVFLVVTYLDDPDNHALQSLAESLPHGAWESSLAPSWGPFFGSAVDLVADACAAYIPQ